MINQSQWPNVSDSVCRRIAAAADELNCLEAMPAWSDQQIDQHVTQLERHWRHAGSGAEAQLTASAWPRRFGRFEIKRLLGHGGFGIVYQVFDPSLDRLAALKVPRPNFLASPDLQRRLMHEAQAAAMLDHPGIVPIFEIGHWGPVVYILSGYCAGPTLANWLAAGNERVNFRQAAQITIDLADAIQHAHARGVLHRDLKPSNILLDINGTQESPVPRLTDFGLAKRLSRHDEAQPGALLGTPAYMAPEQAACRDADVGVQSDVYSLGSILYELLCGQTPFRDECGEKLLARIQFDSPTAPRHLRSDIPRDLEAICLKCLEKAPQNRYATARELAADLRRYLAGECIAAREVRWALRTVRWCQRHPLATLLLAALLLSLTVGISGVASQWLRAERNLSIARTQTERAEKNLAHAHQTLQNLAWMVEEKRALDSQ